MKYALWLVQPYILLLASGLLLWGMVTMPVERPISAATLLAELIRQGQVGSELTGDELAGVAGIMKYNARNT